MTVGLEELHGVKAYVMRGPRPEPRGVYIPADTPRNVKQAAVVAVVVPAKAETGQQTMDWDAA